MSRIGRNIRILISAASLAAGSTYAVACGFEDPKSANFARGSLNWAFPNALYVTSAIWRAQLEGAIPRNDLPSANKALLGYGEAVKQLGILRDGLSKVRDGQITPAFSLVLIGPMLWTHFEPTQTGLNMRPLADGPSNGDVVLVTDGPVIRALIDGQVTPQAALERGLIRFYGAPELVEDVTSWLDRFPAPVSDAPLERVQQTSN
jgi:hypothetical protein